MPKVKVATCWDDGVTTDIRLIALLHKYNAKATFNLNPGSAPQFPDSPTWKTAGENGWSRFGFRPGKVGLRDLKAVYGDFCVASHNWRHETVGRCTDQEFIKAAVDARKFLEDTFQKPCPDFAWPCGVVSPETIALLHENGFQYGRTCKYSEDITTCEEPLALNSNCHFLDDNFYEKFQNAKKYGAFYFWGHSYETLNYEPLWQQLEYKLAYLANDPDVEWVDVIDLVSLLHK